MDLKKPLSLFEKAVAGVKGFVKTAVDYLPRGIVFDALLFGGLIFAASMIPAVAAFNPLGVMSAAGGVNWGGVVKHAMASLAIGGALSGVVGAVRQIGAETSHRDTEIMSQAHELQRYRNQAPHREHVREYEDITPPGNLPRGAQPIKAPPR